MEDKTKAQSGHSNGHSARTGELIIGNDEGIQSKKRAHGMFNPLPKRLYSLPEAAHYMGRTLWSMRELIWKGSIPIVREGKRIFVDIADMDAYAEKHKTTYL